MTEPFKIWIKQCQTVRGIEAEFGVPKALEYLIGEKVLNGRLARHLQNHTPRWF
jgi:hypothetical protein